MNFVPIAIALRPRKLIAALPSARAIFAPSPGLSPPSILTQWIVSVFARPASCAARVTFAPLTGQTNRIPLPGCSGVRRAKTSSRSAPALASASSLSAAPPARSTSIADQTSAFVTLIAMVFPLSGMQPANLLPCGRLWLASAQVAAVGHVDHRAVQDHRRVEGEPADGFGDLFRPPGAPGVGIPHELLDALGLRLPEQLGFHRPRRHRIHLDAVRAQIGRKTAGEADHPGLRHAVPQVGVRREGGHRSDVDDAAALSLDHLLREGADQLHRRFEVDPQDAPARLFGVALDRHRRLHAGIVDEHVDCAEGFDERGDALQVFKIISNPVRPLRKPQIETDDAQSRRRQRLRGREADPPAGAGDQRGLQPSPGIEKPFALSSLIRSFSWTEFNSISGGRRVFHCGSLAKCATVAFSAAIIGCFCTILRVAVMAACRRSASGERQLRYRLSIGPGLMFPVAVMQPLPPWRMLASRNSSLPADTSKPLFAKCSSIALVFGQSPEESFTPATMPGYLPSSRSIRPSEIGTCDTGGM